MSIREQISSQLVFYPDIRAPGGLRVNAHQVIDLAEAHEQALIRAVNQLPKREFKFCSNESGMGYAVEDIQRLLGIFEEPVQ